MKKVIIIGAGIGGLATANLLAKAGYDVHVYEKASGAGGRAGQVKIDGFTFDTGPSWYLMPEVFRHYYALLDESVETHLNLKKLSPAYKVFFERQSPIVITGDITTDKQTFDQIETGAGRQLLRYLKRSDMIYQLSLRHFLYSNFEKKLDLLHPEVVINSLSMLQLALRPIHSYVSKFVKDQRLRQILEYPMVFLGTSPFSAPAIYSLMSALDFKEGVYYPVGGIYTIIDSLVAIGARSGVTYHYNTEVEKIMTVGNKATGVLVNGDMVPADVVISNSDLYHTEMNLLDTTVRSYPEQYWQKKEASPSALLISLGIKGGDAMLEHHNLLFVDEWKANFDAMYSSKQAPDKASIYVCKPSKTDSTVAPPGYDNLFILVPLPSGVIYGEQQTKQLTDHYIKQVEAMTQAVITPKIVVQHVFGPDDFATQYYSWQSSMLGQSHRLRQSAFFRTPNKSKKLANLYYVGGNSTPGIGLPMCLIGAELIYKRLAHERRSGPVQAVKRLEE